MTHVQDLLRPNRFVIDLRVIRENAAALRRLAGPQLRLFATIKADAYGFGLVPVARTVLEAGADALSVVRLEDAAALRDAGMTCPILLYAGQVLGAAHVRAIEQYDLWPAIHNRQSLEALATHLSRPIGCALKIECGQERLGIRAEEAGTFAADLLATGMLRIEVVHTHPQVEEDAGHLEWQYGRFKSACEAVRTLVPGDAPTAVFAGTRVLAMRRDMMLSGIDPGQALFRLPRPIWDGVEPSPTPFKLLASKLIHAYDVQRAAYLSLSRVPTAPGSRIGIVPIGYGDGLSRLHAGIALVRGMRVPVLEPLSIEYARIDLSRCPEADVGDEVVFVGRQGTDCITPDEVMQHTGVPRVTDLVIPLGSAVPREYLPAHD